RRVGTFGTTYPEELAKEVSGMIQPTDRVDPALIQQMFHLPASPDPKGAENVEYIRQAISTTQGYTDIALHLVETSRPSLLAIYFEGTDTAEHLFMNYAAPRLPWVSDQEFAAYKDVVAEYWQWQDQQLGRLLEKRGKNTTVVVVSDHGFRTGAERLKEQEFKIELADASHLPDGIIMVSGPGVKSGARLTGADVYDVAPTILQVLGLPVANDFKGEPIASAFDEAWSAAHPMQFVRTFETGPWDRGKEIVVDPSVGKDMEKMLTSLGYVSSASTSARPVGHEAVEQKVNMAVVLRKQNRLEEARTMLEAVIKEHPDHVGARTNLARVYVEQSEFASAEKIYRELIREHPSDLAHYEDLGHTLVRQGKQREAKDVYEQGLKVDPNWTVGMMGKALALKELGESAPALSLMDKALTKDPSNAEALYSRGVILAKDNRDADAAVAFERALALDPDHLDAAIALSNVKDKLGDTNGALAAAESAKQYHPDDAHLAAQLGALHLKLGHMRKAAVELERASKTLDDPIVLGNYGAAQEALGDFEGAAATFERVVKLDPKSPEALATLGQIQMRQGRFKDAEDLLTRAIRIKPDDAKTQFALGVVYDMTGRLDLAGKQYRTAINLDDSVGVFYYQLGKVYGRQGKEEQAVNLLEKGRKLDPALPPPGAEPTSVESTR
ncbi:MAG TPA: tetratricopeptide repeat protein, partial [Candidatus Krumholzibacteria bacterium]|nr:tetratricopeptide repeat protein [Candidatus Krumholzibacteria bacterium]